MKYNFCVVSSFKMFDIIFLVSMATIFVTVQIVIILTSPSSCVNTLGTFGVYLSTVNRSWPLAIMKISERLSFGNNCKIKIMIGQHGTHSWDKKSVVKNIANLNELEFKWISCDGFLVYLCAKL